MLPVMAAPQWGPGRYAADREPRLAKLRSAAALLPLGTGQTSNCGDGTARMKTCGENLTDARGDSSSPDQASLRSGKLSGLNRNRCPTSAGIGVRTNPESVSGLPRNHRPTSIGTLSDKNRIHCPASIGIGVRMSPDYAGGVECDR